MINRVGKKYGMLTVLSLAYNDKSKSKTCRIAWNCKCDCGNLCIAIGHSLKRGRKIHCGCKRPLNKNIRPRGKANLTRLFGTYKTHAKRRNLSWDININDFETITSKNCDYCGIEPKQIVSCKRGNGSYIYNGIDRVDNNRGYRLDNCVPCCKLCNWGKTNLTKSEFLMWIRRVFNHSYEWTAQ